MNAVLASSNELQFSYRSIKYRYVHFGGLLHVCHSVVFFSILVSAQQSTLCNYIQSNDTTPQSLPVHMNSIEINMHHSMIDINAVFCRKSKIEFRSSARGEYALFLNVETCIHLSS